MKRRQFIAGLGSAAAWPLAAGAQQRMRRIGVLLTSDENDPLPKTQLSAFTQALADLGWTDGRNVRMDIRWGGGDINRIPALVQELVGLQPDIILTNTTPATVAVQRETRTIPIVFVNVADPVASGIVARLDRPSENITAARSLKVVLIIAPVHSEAEIETAISALGRELGGGLVVMPGAFQSAHRVPIISAVVRNNVPAVHSASVFARDGGLLSYGVDQIDTFRRAATYVDRLLRGAKPSELPVQLPTKFEMVVNLKTAKTLGLTVPQSILLSADEVIE